MGDEFIAPERRWEGTQCSPAKRMLSYGSRCCLGKTNTIDICSVSFRMMVVILVAFCWNNDASLVLSILRHYSLPLFLPVQES
jgi:hypothetical protein